MAWSAPMTWVSGQIPTAAQLNTDLRDNLNELALHSHSGGSGSGTAALGNLVTVTFIDAAAPSAPGGTLTRVYSSSTGLYWRNGGGIFGIATSAHEHSISTGSALLVTSLFGTGNTSWTTGTFSLSTLSYGTLASATASATLVTQTATIGGSGSRAVAVTGHVTLVYANGGGTDQISLDLFRDGTSVISTSSSVANGHLKYFVVSAVETNRASGSCTYILRLNANNSTMGTIAVMSRGLVVQEVKQS